MTEGRQALSVQIAGIEGGIECARLAPLLSALADGEATADQLAVLRPHMKTCLACRARLREFRAAPSRVAALVPAGLVGASAAPGEVLGPALGEAPERGVSEAFEPTVGATPGKLEALMGAFQQKAEALLGATQHKAAVFAERAHTAAELVSAQKVAAVAASAAALAGGGTALDQLANHRGPPRPATAHHAKPAQAEQAQPAQPPPSPPAVAPEPAPTTEHSPSPAPPPESPPPSPPDPANEFAPATTANPQASESTEPVREPASSSPGPAPAQSIAPATPTPPTQAAPAAPRSAGEFAP